MLRLRTYATECNEEIFEYIRVYQQKTFQVAVVMGRKFSIEMNIPESVYPYVNEVRS